MAEAQSSLGLAYRNGAGVPKDLDAAMDWLQRAAGQDYLPAIHLVGTIYENGGLGGAGPDYAKAAAWYLRAAQAGSALAQNSLAGLYDDGLGVANDKSEAVRWLRLAADQGLAAAQTSLGSHLLNGEGVAPDPAEAMRWLMLAANQEDGLAQLLLGVIYLDGGPVPQDEQEAVRWLRRAAVSDDADARKGAAEMLSRLGQ